MAFRIHKGIFQSKNASNVYENKFKIDDESGALIAVDAQGAQTAAFLKTTDVAADSNLLDGLDSTAFLKTSGGSVSASNGAVLTVTKSGSAPGNNTTLLVTNTYANHSWGIVGEFRIDGNSGTDKPAILFSSGQTSTSWSVGYKETSSNFGIAVNRGWRNGSWGTNLMEMDASGNVSFTGSVTASGGNSSNWNTAYGWGNHASAGYLSTSYLSTTNAQLLTTSLGVTSLPYSCDIIVYGESNMYYPVHLIWGDQDVWRRIIIKRGYSEQAPSDWYTATHKGGLLLDWEGNFGGWGGATYSDRLRTFNESYSNIVASMYRTTHSMGYTFFLRGGGTTGAVYHIFSDQAIRGFRSSTEPDIAYDTNYKFYENTTYPQYDVYAPAPMSAVDSDRINSLRTLKRSELDAIYQPVGSYLGATAKAADSNLLDGIDSGSFVRSDANDTISGKINFTYHTNSDPLSAVEINGGGTHSGLLINPAANSQAHVRFATNGSLKWQIRVPFQDGANSEMKIYSWVDAADRFRFSHNGDFSIDGDLYSDEVRSRNYWIGNALYFGGGNNYINWTGSNRIYTNAPMQVAGTTSGMALQVGNGTTHGVYTADNARNALVVGADYYPHVFIVASGSGNGDHGAVLSFVGTEGTTARQWNMGTSNQNPFLFSIGYNSSGNNNPHYGLGDNWSSSDADHARLLIDRSGNVKIRGSLYVNGTKGAIDTGSKVATESWVSSNYQAAGSYAAASHTHGILHNTSGNGYQLQYNYGNELNAYDNASQSTTLYINYRGGAVYVEGGNQVLHSGNISSYAASTAHTHDDRYYTETEVDTLLAGKLSTSGKAADAETVDGIDSSRIVYGDGSNGKSINRSNGSANTSDSTNASGFYYGYNVTGMPSTDWWNWLTVRGNSWSGSDGYQFQLAGSFWEDDYRIRRMQSGSNKAWVTLIHSGNIGSQSVNYATTAGALTSMNISQFTNNSGYITANGATGSNGNFYIDDNYGYGIVGTYSATRYQGIWAMGDSYKLPADGTTPGTLYGLAWTYNPDYAGAGNNAQAKPGLNHQMLLMMNGRTYTALGAGIWTDGTITTTSHGTSANWNTAYGWGNHGAQGYLKINTSDIQTQTAQTKIKSYSNAWAGGLALISQDGTKTFQLHPDNNGWMYTDNTWYFTSNIISSSGVKLGIGTTSPSYSIHAEGTIYGDRAWASNLAGANKVKDSTNLGVARGNYEETAFVDGNNVLAFVSVGNGNSGSCFSWFSTENIPVDPNKDYEFSVWVKSDGSDHVYMGWHEYTAGSEIITSNPYFHTDKEDTAGGWMKITARLKGWQTSSPQAPEAQDRWVSNRSTQAAETHSNDGVMHSNTAFVHMRCGTCYGSVNGSKTYFYAPKITELDYHIHDERYYTQSEMDTLLAGKQASGSYAASSHTHDDRYYTESEIDTKLATKAASSHTHAISDVTGLQTALDGKQAAGSYAASSHTHTFTSLTSKPTTLAGYGITDAATSGQGAKADTAYGWNPIVSATVSNDTTTYTKADGSTFALTTSDANTNKYLNGASFNTADGVLTLTVASGTSVTVDLDGRYLESLPTHNHDGSYLPISGKAADSNLLDGLDLHTGRNNEANKVVRTDGNGYIQAGWINTTSGNNGTTAIDRIYASHDGYIRYYTPANFRAQVTDGVYQPVGSYAASSHTHDDRYYTESEVNSLLSGKQDAGSYATAAQGAKADTAYGWNPIVSATVSNDTTTFVKADGSSFALTTSDANSNTYVTAASFNTADGVLTLTRNSGSVTVDLDGRYQPAGSYLTSLPTHDHSISEVRDLQAALDTIPTNNNQLTNGAGYQTSSGTVNYLNITGYGNGNFSFYQSSGSFAGYTGWANYFIGNHGNGSNYYNTTHIMPFWGAPRYSRLEGGALRGTWAYWTEENFTPSAKADLAGSSSVTFSANDMNVYAWTRIHGGNGIYFQSYGYGLRSPNGEGVTYGNIATYGTGRNGWSGYSVGNWISLMAIEGRRGLFLTSEDRWLIKWDTSEAFSDYEIQMGSDARNKSNVQTLTGSLDKVKALRGVSYNYKNQEKTSLGFIAQEVKQVIPEVVSADSEGYYAIGYQSLIAVLSEAIKEQQTIIDALTARVEALENNS